MCRNLLGSNYWDGQVAVIDKTPTWFLSAFPDGKRLLYSQVDLQSADLYLVENFH
jgi:hypothetical protein